MVLFGLQDREADIRSFFQKWNTLVADGLPDNLSLGPGIFPVPNVGPCVVIIFDWIGPESDECTAWRTKVEALGGPIVNNTIKSTSTADTVREIGAVLPLTTYPGRTESANLRGIQFSDEFIDVMARHGAAIPPTACLCVFHLYHGYSTGNPDTPAVFRHRTAHSMLEIVGMSTTKEGGEECRKWAAAFGREARRTEGALEGAYGPLTPQDVSNLEEIYGDKYGRLLELKRRFDPHNVFRNSLPRLEI